MVVPGLPVLEHPAWRVPCSEARQGVSDCHDKARPFWCEEALEEPHLDEVRWRLLQQDGGREIPVLGPRVKDVVAILV